MGMFCLRCGRRIPEGERFCEECKAEDRGEKYVRKYVSLPQDRLIGRDVAIGSLFLAVVSILTFQTGVKVARLEDLAGFVLFGSLGVIAAIAALVFAIKALYEYSCIAKKGGDIKPVWTIILSVPAIVIALVTIGYCIFVIALLYMVK